MSLYIRELFVSNDYFVTFNKKESTRYVKSTRFSHCTEPHGDCYAYDRAKSSNTISFEKAKIHLFRRYLYRQGSVGLI